MSNKRYTEEFKTEAVKQVLDRGHSTAAVAARLGINKHSLYDWVRRRAAPGGAGQVEANNPTELRRLRAELKRVTEERDILKKAAAYFAKQSG
jgi:transposase